MSPMKRMVRSVCIVVHHDNIGNSHNKLWWQGLPHFQFPEAQQAPWYSPDTTVLHWHALAAITLLSSPSLAILPSLPILPYKVRWRTLSCLQLHFRKTKRRKKRMPLWQPSKLISLVNCIHITLDHMVEYTATHYTQNIPILAADISKLLHNSFLV